ncbi:MAG: Ribonuclease D [uncultured Solirubrobacteraceae bacterium]|uniref:Ribonuclease D n=1 Tax=uncultured Solirubrobacteraceae bacterium TaxID=1162706 RepID=A0A6J4SCA5_9ACTN|nr:MAG: Ribonuclease D [uncultured Solirubrobacteraceae bacterium]
MPVDLQAFADRARRTGRMGIDTEFMGEGRYRSLLCVVQIVVENPEDPSDEVQVEVLDALDDSIDPTPVAEVLADPAVEVVLHAARQDVALLRRTWRTTVTNVFDTQVAAGFTGRGAQMGYDPLLQDLLGIRLSKSASFTKWDQRPLTDEQVEYARGDVLHLLQLASAIQADLERLGRLDWAREECRFLEASTDERDLDVVFNKLPRIGGLEPSIRAVARELVEWREETARTQDKPISTVLADAPLVEIARRKPRDIDKLRQIRGLNEQTLRRRGRDIVAAVERGRDREPIPRDGDKPIGHDPLDSLAIALCEALVRSRTLESEMAYELVAARADLERIVKSVRVGAEEPKVRTLAGWRRELVGAELIELLNGRRTLRLLPDRRLAVESSE